MESSSMLTNAQKQATSGKDKEAADKIRAQLPFIAAAGLNPYLAVVTTAEELVSTVGLSDTYAKQLPVAIQTFLPDEQQTRIEQAKVSQLLAPAPRSVPKGKKSGTSASKDSSAGGSSSSSSAAAATPVVAKKRKKTQGSGGGRPSGSKLVIDTSPGGTQKRRLVDQHGFSFEKASKGANIVPVDFSPGSQGGAMASSSVTFQHAMKTIETQENTIVALRQRLSALEQESISHIDALGVTFNQLQLQTKMLVPFIQMSAPNYELPTAIEQPAEPRWLEQARKEQKDANEKTLTGGHRGTAVGYGLP